MKSSVVVIPFKPTIAPETKRIGLAPRAAIGCASDAPNDDRALKALRVSESRYHRLFETAQDGILLLNADTAQIEDVNPYLIEMLGYSHAEFLGKKLWEVGSFADIAQSKEMFAELQTKGYVRYDDLPLKTRAGTRIAVEFVSNTYDCEGIKVIQCNIRNITEHKADQSKIQRHTRLYAALSQCNKAIVHCVSEEESLRQICRAAVQFGGMKMAWVCFVDTETLMVRPGASFGDDTEYLRSLNISVDADSPLGYGPTATAIRENRPFWCQDFLNDPLTAPWHDRAAHAGFAASASLPLHSKGIVVGAFTLYSGAANCFDESARDLLLEMAADISFALDNFTGESQRRLVEEALVRASHRNQVFLRNASDGVHILDADGNVLEVSDSFCKMLGYSRDELIDANVMLWDTQWSPQELKQRIAEMLGKEGRSVFETRHRRRDGSFLDVEVTAQGLELDGKRVLFNSARDITERKRTEEEIRRYVEQLKTAFMSTVEVVTTLGELRDPYTAGHQRKVAEIAAAIGAELGFDARRQEGLRVAGYLHDIGKITIPSEILSKPGKLGALEFQLVQGHAQASYEVLKGVEFPWPVAEVALQHHERVDGSGYPQGLKGEAILLEARIMAVADVVEAMSSHRPYRPGLGIEAALTEIERGRGTLYDPVVADACLKLFREKGYAIPG